MYKYNIILFLSIKFYTILSEQDNVMRAELFLTKMPSSYSQDFRKKVMPYGAQKKIAI